VRLKILDIFSFVKHFCKEQQKKYCGDNMPKIEAGKPMTLDVVDLLRREKLALSKLTDKQKIFCEAYVRTFDKLLSMKEAGYWTPKHEKGGAQTALIQQTFEHIMSSESVKEYISLLKQSIASRLGFSMDDIVEQYKAMAFANMDDYVRWNADGIVAVQDSEHLTRAQKAGILEITETTTKAGKTIKIKLHSKQTSLDKLFKILKELEEHETKPKGPAEINNNNILIMLQDPVARRSLENIAGILFTKKIKLVGTDKNKEEFNKHLEAITGRLLEAQSGVGIEGPGTIRETGIPQITEDSGAGGARGSCREVEDAENRHSTASFTEQDGEDRSSADIPNEGNRYPLDGL